MADEGPTEKELKDAKSYLTGSYPLRFDTSPKIASQLLGIQIEDLGLDYIDKRNAQIEAVTLDEIRAIAKRLLKPDNMLITIVGQPTPPAAEPKAAIPAAKGGKG
jgi:zinc protease